MKDVIKALFSHAEGSHRASGIDNLFEFIEEQSFGESDCGA